MWKGINMELWRLIRFNQYFNRIKWFLDEDWYDWKEHMHGNESSQTNPNEGWYESRKSDTILSNTVFELNIETVSRNICLSTYDLFNLFKKHGNLFNLSRKE